MLDHLENIYKRTDKLDERIIQLDSLPHEIAYLWEWFTELSAARSSGFGQNPIGYRDIAAWANLTGRSPSPWEIETIRAMDSTYLSAVADQERKQNGN